MDNFVWAAVAMLIIVLGGAAYMSTKEGILAVPETANVPEQEKSGESDIDTAAKQQVVSGEDVSGNVRAAFYEDRYSLRGTFDGLPGLSENEFYEGWIIREKPRYDRISTGDLSQEGDAYVSTFGSGRDLTTYDTYVLTREIRDGDPAPGEFVLEMPIEILEGEHAF